MNSHATEKRFECDLCSKKFVWPNVFKRHIEMHTRARDMKCDVCSDVLANESEHAHHMLDAHPGVNIYQCEQCEERFPFPSKKDAHMDDDHAKERPFTCLVCGKGYTQSGSLKRHILIHNDEHQCELCGLKFKRSYLLQNHLREAHREAREKRPNQNNSKKKHLDRQNGRVTIKHEPEDDMEELAVHSSMVKMAAGFKEADKKSVSEDPDVTSITVKPEPYDDYSYTITKTVDTDSESDMERNDMILCPPAAHLTETDIAEEHHSVSNTTTVDEDPESEPEREDGILCSPAAQQTGADIAQEEHRSVNNTSASLYSLVRPDGQPGLGSSYMLDDMAGLAVEEISDDEDLPDFDEFDENTMTRIVHVLPMV